MSGNGSSSVGSLPARLPCRGSGGAGALAWNRGARGPPWKPHAKSPGRTGRAPARKAGFPARSTRAPLRRPRRWRPGAKPRRPLRAACGTAAATASSRRWPPPGWCGTCRSPGFDSERLYVPQRRATFAHDGLPDTHPSPAVRPNRRHRVRGAGGAAARAVARTAADRHVRQRWKLGATGCNCPPRPRRRTEAVPARGDRGGRPHTSFMLDTTRPTMP